MVSLRNLWLMSPAPFVAGNESCGMLVLRVSGVGDESKLIPCNRS